MYSHPLRQCVTHVEGFSPGYHFFRACLHRGAWNPTPVHRDASNYLILGTRFIAIAMLPGLKATH